MNPANISLAITYAAISVVGQPPPKPASVALRDGARITAITLDHLRREVESIFSPAGIQIDWSSYEANPLIRVLLQTKPSLSMVSGCSRNLHDHRLAVTTLRSRRIVLWTEQVARGAAGDWDSKRPPRLPHATLGRALGRVLAHELGHLFMDLHRHRSRGLMRPSFRFRDLTMPNTKRLFLSPEDIEKLQQGVKELLHQVKM